MTITNFHDKLLTETSATCPVTGETWSIGDKVIISMPSGVKVAATITKLREVRQEIFADVEQPLNYGMYRLTDKLQDLVRA